jgi:hypothetical protein
MAGDRVSRTGEGLVMTEEHWIDRLSQALARHTSRRASLRLAALLASILVHGGPGEMAGAKNKKKQQQNTKGNGGKTGKKGKGKKGNGKKGKGNQGNSAGTPGPTQPPDDIDECVASGPDVPLEEWTNDCREIREQCHPPDDFCIFIPDGLDPNNDRTVTCCPSPKECCSATPSHGCFDLRNDPNNCGICGKVCGPDERCVDRSCLPVCRTENCPEGTFCYGNNGFCHGQATSDCRCHCPLAYHCQERSSGRWVCQTSPC